jgi:hypothetical protein
METPMSDQTTAIEVEIPDPPIEPIKLISVWREAATQLLAQGEAAAAGAFLGCASMLEAWIKHEGTSVILCMPQAFRVLILAAHEFAPDDKESWKALGQAARAFRLDGAA